MNLHQFIAFILTFLFCITAKSQKNFTINKEDETIAIEPSQIKWLADAEGSATFNDYINHSPGFINKPDFLKEKKKNFWCNFSVLNNTNFDKEYFIQTSKTGIVECWIRSQSDTTWKTHRSGSLLKLKDRSLQSNIDGIIIQLPKSQPVEIVMKFKSGLSIYQTNNSLLTLVPLATFERQDSNRLLWQGLFLGVILVMALYNLIIFFAVKDLSYLYYVLSLVGLGLYFSFYYGVAIEYLWPNAPLWDTYCFMVIVPFNGLSRIFFTKTYLHTATILPQTNIVLNILASFCGLLMIAGIVCYCLHIDVLNASVSIVGILGTIILFMMLYSGFVAFYREGYKPAQYFIYANVLLVVGGALFITRELRLLPDNFLTRYLIQIGTLVQVILFALGLASRLNNTRIQLANEIVEKERLALEREIEKKELFEKQKAELQLQVEEQTADLKRKNLQLEDIILQLKNSELKLTQLNQLKDKLFSIISHDLRNPLATMQSTLKLITEHHNKLDEDEKKKLSHEAQASLDNLNQLLYNLLQWSRSQMNLLQFKEERFGIHPVLINCVKVLQLNAHIKNIRIHVVAEENLYGYADKDMIEFVIRNLLSNAIKFSYRDSDVYVKATLHKNLIKLQVLDSGIGLSASKIKKLLELNESITRRGTEKEKGTGLGLLISKDFIEKNGGSLHIESEPGKGSCFSFSILDYTGT
ncbi:MAG: sensor histidine kinase [Segetibacter sp.]